ncbi:hypothetical protein [Acinetobacter wuhouensis]|uniref:Lipoprotein n=1 Tax=Acinetobacter wuhouensis TaxID=1879050 RepID=A0A4V2DN33_9GAMM|nr:hypothetical protein [Acinetobacter wuhouensis]RZG46349.1 hypothetical protein EXU28_09865 [Acinetobacter wuhouensis]RZG71171.1 hypothetical protein EXU29_14990 [Acinetobacter wuhouensis]
MKAMTKITLVSASVLAMGALTACQSNPSPKEGHDGRGMMHGDKHHRMSPEQREQMKQMRAERHEFKKLAQTACDNKAVGSTVSFKVNEKSVEGTCAINFHPDRGAMKALRDTHRDTDRVKDHDNRHDHHHFKRGQELTAEQKAQFEQQRAERKAQFEQKRAERQAKWDAIQSACNGQTNGKQIQAKVDDKLIAGTCVVHFKPNARPDMMGKPMHAPAPVDAPVPPKA